MWDNTFIRRNGVIEKQQIFVPYLCIKANSSPTSCVHVQGNDSKQVCITVQWLNKKNARGRNQVESNESRSNGLSGKTNLKDSLEGYHAMVPLVQPVAGRGWWWPLQKLQLWWCQMRPLFAMAAKKKKAVESGRVQLSLPQACITSCRIFNKTLSWDAICCCDLGWAQVTQISFLCYIKKLHP